jgi:DNA polymerase-3 subunit epsilon
MVYQITTDEGYFGAKIGQLDDQTPVNTDTILGTFKSQKQAKSHLLAVAKESGLCHKLLGLEYAEKGCFPYQLGWCSGACLKKESPLRYNIRFIEAFHKTKIQRWPYPGAIIITETDNENERNDTFLVDKWCLTRIDSVSEATSTIPQFNVDTYAILSRYINSLKHQKNIRLQTG